MTESGPGPTISVAAPSAVRDLVVVKDGYGRKDVTERFRRLEQDVDGTWFLIRRNGRVVGWCVVKWSGKETHPECPDVEDLYIRPEDRNQGLGARLLHHAEQVVRARGHSAIGLAVNPELNRPARRFYERLGYRHDGKATYLDGIYGGNEDWVIDLEKPIRTESGP